MRRDKEGHAIPCSGERGNELELEGGAEGDGVGLPSEGEIVEEAAWLLHRHTRPSAPTSASAPAPAPALGSASVAAHPLSNEDL